MSPRQRSVVSLVVIVLSLGATLVAQRLEPPPAPPPSALLQPVFDIPAAAVRAIDVDSWQGRLRAHRTDAGWQVDDVHLGKGSTDDPETALPTAEEVNAVLDTLVAQIVATPEIDRFAPDAMPMRDFGLDPPQAHIALDLDSGAKRTLQIGELTVTTSALYARILPAPDIVQIGSLIFNNVAAALFRLRSLEPTRGIGGAE